MKGSDILPKKLWTKDFTIITVGSFISMAGNSLASFAMSLFVLDYTESTMLYALYIFLYTLPQIASPVISGTLMDRFSRRKTIYMLDFSVATLYLALGLTVWLGFFNFGIFAVGIFISGMINSAYLVAFESFYPMLISEGNFGKAYSISSVLETMTTVMIPVATLIYNTLGIFPLMLIDSALFFTAAIFETQISPVESDGTDLGEKYRIRQYIDDTKEGIRYLMAEKGLLAITIYFMVSFFTGGAEQVITLPWFRETFTDGEYTYMSVWLMMSLGRVVGGLLHYRINFPVNKKFNIALFVYVAVDLIEGFYLFASSLWTMRIACFILGILGVTSYNIRVSSTQSYVPNEKKGRFNGIFIMTNTIGSILGELISGTLAEVFPMRNVLAGFMLFAAVCAFIIVGGNAKHIKPIYNRKV